MSLILVSDIFSLALLFAIIFHRRTTIISSMQMYAINVL